MAARVKKGAWCHADAAGGRRPQGANVTFQSCLPCVDTSPLQIPGHGNCTAKQRAASIKRWGEALACEPRVTQPRLFDSSSYAAVLAWWLAFFPPEQILLMTSNELHDPSTRIQVRARCGPLRLHGPCWQ